MGGKSGRDRGRIGKGGTGEPFDQPTSSDNKLRYSRLITASGYKGQRHRVITESYITESPGYNKCSRGCTVQCWGPGLYCVSIHQGKSQERGKFGAQPSGGSCVVLRELARLAPTPGILPCLVISCACTTLTSVLLPRCFPAEGIH